MTSSASAGPHDSQRPQTLWQDTLHIWALLNLAVTQSYYTRLVHQPEYLINSEVTPDAVFWVGVTMTLLFPILVTGVVALVGWWFPRGREAARGSLVFLTASLLMLQVMHTWSLPASMILIGGLLGGVLVTWLYQKFRSTRQIVSLCSLGILLTPLILYSEFWGAAETAAFRMERDPAKPRVPVVLVVFDEFSGPSILTPEMTIDETRFPHFAELVQGATWYRNACAVAPLTVRALPAILTARFPSTTQLSTPRQYPQNLFQSLISGADYEHVAFEPVSVVAPQHPKVAASSIRQRLQRAASILKVLTAVYAYDVVPADYHERLPEIPRNWFGLIHSNRIDRQARRGTFRYGWATQRDQQLEHFLQCIDETHEGVLYFGHFLIPHAPWCLFPSGKRYAVDGFDLNRGCLDKAGTVTDELGLAQSQQRYLLQLMYLDRFLGQLVDRLKSKGIYDECLLIVTADHGISFRLDDSRREFSSGNTTDIARIPLVVKYPHQKEGDVQDAITQSTDLLPTIFNTVGLHPQLPIDGCSLSDPQILHRQEATVIDHGQRRLISSAVLKETSLPVQIRQRFGDSRDPWNIYRIGPHSKWLGQPLTKFQISTLAAKSIERLVAAEPLGELAHQEYQLEGRLLGPIPTSPVELAIAVNGVIVATTRTYTQFGYQDRWSVLLPEWSYDATRAGPEYFVIESDHTLTPCRVVSSKTPDQLID